MNFIFHVYIIYVILIICIIVYILDNFLNENKINLIKVNKKLMWSSLKESDGCGYFLKSLKKKMKEDDIVKS